MHDMHVIRMCICCSKVCILPIGFSIRAHVSVRWSDTTLKDTSQVFFGDSLMRGVRPKKKPNIYAIISLQITRELGMSSLGRNERGRDEDVGR